MNNHYRGTSRLGKMSVDHLFVEWSTIEQEQIDREAAAIVARSLAGWKQEPVELPVDAVIEALRELANMTAEEEARLNQIILDQEAGL
jgi:hypothetical protein